MYYFVLKLVVYLYYVSVVPCTTEVFKSNPCQSKAPRIYILGCNIKCMPNRKMPLCKCSLDRRKEINVTQNKFNKG